MNAVSLEQIQESINKNINGRKLVVWGRGKNSKEIEYFIESCRGVKIEFWVDSDTDKVDGIHVMNCDCLDGKSDEFYICVSLSIDFDEIHSKLADYGYIEKKDYIYPSERHKPLILNKVDNYIDRWGNQIEGNLEGCKIILTGRDSYIKIGENCSADNLTIKVASNSYLSFGKSVNLNNRVQEKNIAAYIQVDDQAKLVIEDDVRMIGPGDITLRKKAGLFIGRNTRIWSRYDFHILHGTDTIIGRDCLFSTYVSTWSNDGHPIYDLATGQHTNLSEDSRSIVIGNHVWVGNKATILYSTQIGDGSIVGANALVKSKFPNNCMVAGVPAKILRKNVAWSKNVLKNGLESLEEDYRQFTEED